MIKKDMLKSILLALSRVGSQKHGRDFRPSNFNNVIITCMSISAVVKFDVLEFGLLYLHVTLQARFL